MAMLDGFIGVGMGGLMSILLSIIAYFLRMLVQDIRDLKKEQGQLRELFIWLKAEQEILRKSMDKSPPESIGRRKIQNT